MSGHKRSEFRLQREREEKLRLGQGIRNLHAEASGLKERVTRLVEGASEGLRSTFAREVLEAKQWLGRAELPSIDGLDMDTDLAVFRATQADLGRAAALGRRIHEALAVAFTQKADEMGQRLARRVAEADRTYISRQQLLRLWFSEGHLQEWERVLNEARDLLSQEQYLPVERLLGESEEETAKSIRWAEEQEDKHQKRLYLLKALRQVCAEMGFEEVSGPRFEKEADRGSRIHFTVDTLNRGRISFALSLDGISSFSEITEDRCFEEFGQLSQYLEEEFGIQTEFRLAEGEPPPKLRQKDEIDLPSDAKRSAQA